MRKLRKHLAFLLITAILTCQFTYSLLRPFSLEVHAASKGEEKRQSTVMTVALDAPEVERAPVGYLASDMQNLGSAAQKGETVVMTGIDGFLGMFEELFNLMDDADTAGLFGDIGGGFGLFNIVQDGLSMQDLEGSLGMQIAQYLGLLASMIIGALGVLGIIGFPWSLILGLILAMVNMILSDEELIQWSIDNSLYWDGTQKVPNGVNCLKPNIYIYNMERTDVKVTFDQPWLLTTTIPEYMDSWEVVTGKEGQLADADGNEYGFLFYESETIKSLFQTEEGYRIPADRREETYRGILTEMGFNEQEIKDFVEFWSERIPEGVDYIMYPQGTDRVDLAMPITISPMPQSIERIWFVFLADEGQEVGEPELIRVERDANYSVIEWGGMIFDE